MNDDTKLTVSLNGRPVTIDVLDIIKNDKFGHEYIIYTIDNLEKSDIFASILNESETSYSLDTIENEEEVKAINDYIKNIMASNGVDENGNEN